MIKLTCEQCGNPISPAGVSCHICGQLLSRDAAMTPIFRQPHGRLGDCDPLLGSINRQYQGMRAHSINEATLLIVFGVVQGLILVMALAFLLLCSTIA